MVGLDAGLGPIGFLMGLLPPDQEMITRPRRCSLAPAPANVA